MSLTVDTNTWVTLAEAEAYCRSRLGSENIWNSDTDVASKEAALITAYNQLTLSDRFSYPSTATEAMKNAQVEHALFLIQHIEDIDLRKSLQVQGVESAGIVKESYDLRNVHDIPIAPIASAFLSTYEVGSLGAHAIELARDENEDLI